MIYGFIRKLLIKKNISLTLPLKRCICKKSHIEKATLLKSHIAEEKLQHKIAILYVEKKMDKAGSSLADFLVNYVFEG